MSFSGMVEFIVVIHKFLLMINEGRELSKGWCVSFLEKMFLEMNYAASPGFGKLSNGVFKSEKK